MFVAAFLYNQFKRVTVLVNGSPQGVQIAVDRDEHFITEPGVARPLRLFSLPAYSGPKRLHYGRIASSETSIPRSARRSSTSR